MRTSRVWSLAIGLAVAIAGWSASSQMNGNDPPDTGRGLLRVHPGAEGKVSGENYAEFPTGVGVLAILSAEAQEKYIPGSTEAARNKNVILEFRVADVDQEYRRLHSLVKDWVKPPSTQPWGTRSVYFRDPDGNLVDFYTPAKAQ